MRLAFPTLPSRRPFRAILTLGMTLLAITPSHALEGRFGPLLSDGPGIWLQGRHSILGTDLGIHLAASSINLRVLTESEVVLLTDSLGNREYHFGPIVPATVSAQFYEFGLIVARDLHASERWNLALSSGILGGILDGTRDVSLRPLATSMLLVPVFVEADWHPFEHWKRLGLTLGAGGVWTSPRNEDNLYPEVSSWRWQARTGILF